jgi:hypothetical protein
MTNFTYLTEDMGGFRCSGRLVLLPAAIKTKDELIERLSEGLSFPSFAKKNWDSLDECLSDLSWLEEKEVTLFHKDIPLSENQSECNKYLLILDGVINEHKDVKFRVVFPTHLRKQIEEGKSQPTPTLD